MECAHTYTHLCARTHTQAGDKIQYIKILDGEKNLKAPAVSASS